MSSLIGTTLGQYQVLEEIGRGGMGAVYKGYDTALDRYVAIKVLAPHLVWEKGFVERFLREARAAAKLDHPHIVTIHTVGQQGDFYYFVMKFLEGQTLAEIIHQQGALPLSRVTGIVEQVATALDYAHAQGLVHRDIKPANIIVSPGDQATLTDFGIAKAAEGTALTGTGTLVGTPQYMAPEQVRGQAVSPQTDIYALGIVCYEMLTGRAPFGGDTPAMLYAHVHESPPPLRSLNPHLPAALESVIGKALAKEPKERYGSATELAAALKAISPVPEEPPPIVKRPVPPPRRSVAPWVWAGLGAMGLVVAVVLIFGRGPGPEAKIATTTALVQLQATRITEAVTAATPTVARTPVPALIATPTKTPAAPQTKRPKATDTTTPRPPTATPTATRTPTTTPTKVVTQAASCDFKPSDTFYSAWQAERSHLGCALNEVKVFTAEQPFENGFMFWRKDKDRFIYVLYNKRTWQIYEGAFKEGDPEAAGYSSPPGLQEPRRGFGQVWRDYLGGPNSEIGWAKDREWGFPDDRWVDCEHGTMLWTNQWGELLGIFVLYDDGTWQFKR